MYKDPHNEHGGTPHSPWAAISDGNLQRTSNREHRWKPRQKPSKHSPDDPWFLQPQGTSAAVPGSNTAPTPDTHTHHQMDTQGLGTTPITPGEPLPSSGVSVSRHSQLHRTDGVWRVETPKQIIQPPQPPKLFPLRGTGPSLGRPYVLLGRCLFK